VIGAASAGNPPAACSGTPNNTVATFGANGILGVGPFINDCNSTGTCSPGSQAANYYSCPTPTTCTGYAAPPVQQVPNPVILLAKDNNGVIIELPAVGAGGSTAANGSLVFGIGTETNNGLGSATQLYADPNSGEISAALGGTTYPNSYLDSGSNANFVNTSFSTCMDNSFLCPSGTMTEDATLTDIDGTNATADFTIANADTLFNDAPNATAYNNLAAAAFDSSSLDLGLSFFFGRNIFTGIENPSTGTNPYFAIASN
jgi:hypothetical protein